MRRNLAVSVVTMVLVGGCATHPGALAPIEERRPQAAKPAMRPPAPAPAPVAAGAAELPETGAVVKPLAEEERPASRALALPAPGDAAALSPPTPGEAGLDEASFVPAVAELVAKADRASLEGQHEAARASLERALTISPRHAGLWQRLASLSYAQEDWAQAKSFAQRSNSLARPDSPLAARNWMLIGNAETRLGNPAAAAAAFERAGVAEP